MPATMTRGNWAQLMAPGLKAIFAHFLALKMREEEWSHIFNQETSENAYEDEMEIGDIGPMPVKEEAEAVTFTELQQGGIKRVYHTAYALGVRSSWELYEDAKYNIINQIPKALVRSEMFTKEINTWNVLNLGFTTTTTIDGVTLFNTQHPLLGGSQATSIGPGVSSYIGAAGTWPNKPFVDVDLSITALQLAINQFERMITSSGLPMMIKPRTLLIPPELKWIAREILGSAHKPYTADNEINSILNEDLKYFVYHWSTSLSNWFLLPAKEDHTLKHYTRKAAFDRFSDDEETFSVRQIRAMRFSAACINWLGLWGSNGP